MYNLIKGGIYRHFKGDYYLAIDTVKDLVDDIDYVLYQSLYDNFNYYLRPMEMFLEELSESRQREYNQSHRFKYIPHFGSDVQFKDHLPLGIIEDVSPKVQLHRIYRDQDGKLYFPEMIAIHSEDSENYIVFRDLVNSTELLMMPLNEFTELVAHSTDEEKTHDNYFELIAVRSVAKRN